jgi:hypothetical protein
MKKFKITFKDGEIKTIACDAMRFQRGYINAVVIFYNKHTIKKAGFFSEEKAWTDDVLVVNNFKYIEEI